MKVAIVYYSKSGNTQKASETIKKGLLENEKITDVKLMTVDEIDKEYLKEAKGIIFGTPTYYANMSWQLKKWFDECPVKLEGKLGACFATCNGFGGGSETALLTIVNHALARGMLMYSGGTALGQPFTHLGAVLIKDGDDFQKERAKIFGNRIGNKIISLFDK